MPDYQDENLVKKVEKKFDLFTRFVCGQHGFSKSRHLCKRRSMYFCPRTSHFDLLTTPANL